MGWEKIAEASTEGSVGGVRTHGIHREPGCRDVYDVIGIGQNDGGLMVGVRRGSDLWAALGRSEGRDLEGCRVRIVLEERAEDLPQAVLDVDPDTGVRWLHEPEDGRRAPNVVDEFRCWAVQWQEVSAGDAWRWLQHPNHWRTEKEAWDTMAGLEGSCPENAYRVVCWTVP